MKLKELGTISTKVGDLQVYHGHELWIVDQLVEKSQSTRLRKTVHRDGEERFVTPDSFEGWVTKGDGGRLLYVAVDHNRLRQDGRPELAGVSWLGRQAFPDTTYPQLPGVRANHTYAIRAYGLEGGIAAEDTDPSIERFYEGTGMSKRLSQLAVGHYAGARLFAEARELAIDDLEPGIWLETGATNPARTGLYPHMFGQGIGYKEVGTHFDPKHQELRAGMVLPLSIVSMAGYVIRD